MPYDPMEFGDDHFFTKREGKIVACLGGTGFTGKQLLKLGGELESFLVPWGEDALEYIPHLPVANLANDPNIIHLRGVTPQDALEALRRKEPQIAAKVEAGILPMWRAVLEQVEI